MFASEFFTDVDGCCLARAFEVQKSAAIFEWVSDWYVRPIPTIAAIVGNIWVAGVVSVEAVGHCDLLPDCNLFAVPCLPRTAQRTLQELPPVCEAMRVRVCAAALGRD